MNDRECEVCEESIEIGSLCDHCFELWRLIQSNLPLAEKIIDLERAQREQSNGA